MKKCSKCGIQKPLVEFSRNKSTKDGHTRQCKSCKAQYRAQNKEKIAKRNARYYEENKEKIAKQGARYRAQNKEKIAKQGARYRSENKEKIAEKNARYYEENKEKIAEYSFRYREENKEKIARYRAQNKEKIAKQQAHYREENKEKIAKQQAQYYEENKEKIAEKRVRYLEKRKAEQPSCVYQIINLINNKVYIGETTRGELRWKGHLTGLRGNYHPNKLLQEDFDKYGEDAFEWNVLKEFEDEDKNNLLLEEARSIQQHIDEGVELYNLALTIEQLKMLTENK